MTEAGRPERGRLSAGPGPSEHGWLGAAIALLLAGWGANQFTPLFVVYRDRVGLSDVAVDAMFGVYILGLMPGLVVGAPLSGRYGRRAVVVPSLVTSLLASLALATGEHHHLALYVGRLLTGIASGTTVSAATAWLAELVRRRGKEVGAAFLTAGFGAGALVASALAQWVAGPLVTPYVVHAGLVGAALLLVARIPETATPQPGVWWQGIAPPSVRHPRLWRVVVPMCPAVFGSAAVAYAVLPGLTMDRVPAFSAIYTGGLSTLTLAVGIAVQPLARRLHSAHSARAVLVGLTVVIAGLVVAAAAAARTSVPLAVVAAVVLGAGYGLCLVAGLLEVERIAPAQHVAALTALYYAATYTGFATPVLLAVLSRSASYATWILVLAGITAACLGVVAAFSHRVPDPARAGRRDREMIGA